MKKLSKTSAPPPRGPADWVALEPHCATSTPFETRQFLGRGIHAQRIAVASGAGFDYSWQGAPHYLAFHQLALQDGEIFQDEGGPVRSRRLNDLLTYIPAGARVWGWSVPSVGTHSFTAVYFDPNILEVEVADRFKPLPVAPRLYFSDPTLRATLAKLHDALSNEAPPQDSLYLESLCIVSALELTARTHAHSRVTHESGRLGRVELERVRDYVEAHLAENITLADLAKVSDLSRFHFLRSFRNSAGETPHQYVLRRRIEKAKMLLQSTTDGPIHLIAEQVGFKSVSRFVLTFRRLVGNTPAAFRNALHAKRRNR